MATWVAEKECKEVKKNPFLEVIFPIELDTRGAKGALKNLCGEYPKTLDFLGNRKWKVVFEHKEMAEVLLSLNGEVLEGQEKPLKVQQAELRLSLEEAMAVIQEKLETQEMKNLKVGASQQPLQRNYQQRRTYPVEVQEAEEIVKVQEVKSQKTQTRTKEDEQAEKTKPKPQSEPSTPAKSSTPSWEQQRSWWEQPSSQGRGDPWSWSGAWNWSENWGQQRGKSKGKGKGKGGESAATNAGKGGRGKGKGEDKEPCYYGDNCRFKSWCRYSHPGDANHSQPQGKGKGKGGANSATPNSSGGSTSSSQ